MKTSAAQIDQEYGPFDGVDAIHGLTHDGNHVWFASGNRINELDPKSGKTGRTLDVAAHAGTAYDGKFFWQIAENQIHKVDPKSGRVVASIPAPGNGMDSGLAWADGYLWVGSYRERKIYQVEPATGKVVRAIESNRFVTGVTWVDGELWHATWENDESDLRHVDPMTGEVLESIKMPSGAFISGMESDGKDRFYCGGGKSGKIRAVRKPAKSK